MNRDDGGARLDRAVQVLMAARRARKWLDALPADAMPQTLDEAHTIQDGQMIRMGGRGGWKVGAATPDAIPGRAPLAARSIYTGRPTLSAAEFHFVGIEGEIAFKFGTTLDRASRPYAVEEVLAAIASVHAGIEIADSRYVDFRSRSALEQTADLGNNGAYILGPASAVLPTIDQLQVNAEIWVDGERIVQKTGGNSAGNVQRLLTWLANHCALRGTPITAGDAVTTGSCTGLEIIQKGSVRAVIAGVGDVTVTIV
ncbi:MAG: 2-keto-4-pentenoate hydratase [Betaproteobacteria bacterium]|nr:2-keto-4-pentenoate hydratase [Betaproteobacteria bacterium]